MKKIQLLPILVFLLVFMPPAYADDDFWFYKSSYLMLQPTITTYFHIEGKPNVRIEYVIANISFFPKQTNTQGILESYYEPVPKIDKDVLSFIWNGPSLGKKEITITNLVRIQNTPPKVNRKVGFPLKEEDIPGEYEVFTEPSEIIDVNSRIIGIASELASGEDDAFVVVDKIADWVNTNILYNLSTITVEASQKSSWVIEHREGVCDELTSLFISMLRSLGIPARFVSGISYTNLDIFKNKWGAHGWAEVYFPGYGWIPFDVTYGEYGWVDPTHIVSKTADDAGKFTSQYIWKAENGISVKANGLDTDVKVVEIGPQKIPFFTISAYVLEEEVDFGSYNLVIGKIKNLADYYQSLDVYLSQTTRLSFIDGSKRHVLLKPNEEKSLYWIMRVDDDLDKDYMYTFPVSAYTIENVTSVVSFMAVDDARHYSLDYINSSLMQSRVEEKLVYSRNVKLECESEKKEYYEYEKPLIMCVMKNTGNVFLKNMRICMKDECMEKNLGITEEKEFNFTVHDKEMGENEVKITASDEDVSKSAYADFNVLDKPEIVLGDVEYPFNATYEGDYAFKIDLKKASKSEPLDVDISVKFHRTPVNFHFGNMSNNKRLDVSFEGSDLTVGRNNITVSISYKDKNGKQYSLESRYGLNLIEPKWWQKMMIFIRTLF